MKSQVDQWYSPRQISFSVGGGTVGETLLAKMDAACRALDRALALMDRADRADKDRLLANVKVLQSKVQTLFNTIQKLR